MVAQESVKPHGSEAVFVDSRAEFGYSEDLARCCA
jgi:hypothetical protein